MKKALSLALCLILILGLAACGAPAPWDSSAVFEKALEAAEKLESVHIDMDMTISFTLSAEGQSLEMPISMSMSMDSVNEPMASFGQIDMSFMGQDTSALSYVVEEDGTYKSYTSPDGGATWAEQELSREELGQFDAARSMEFYLSAASGFSAAGPEEINGVEAMRYNGSISGEQLNEAMSLTGADDMLDSAYGGAGSFEGSMPMSIWIDGDSGLPVRYELDMSEIMTNYTQQSLGEQEGVTLDSVSATVVMDLSQFDAIGSITRPEGIA